MGYVSENFSYKKHQSEAAKRSRRGQNTMIRTNTKKKPLEVRDGEDPSKESKECVDPARMDSLDVSVTERRRTRC